MRFSLEEFEQLKGGAILNKYGKSFIVRPSTEHESWHFLQDMDYVIVNLDHHEYEKMFEYSYMRNGNNIMLLQETSEFTRPIPDGTVQSGLNITLTHATAVRVLFEMYLLLDEDDPSVLLDSEIQGSYFFVTIEDGVWTKMRQAYYADGMPENYTENYFQKMFSK